MTRRVLKTTGKILNVLLILLMALVVLCQLYLLFAKYVVRQDNPTIFGYRSAVVLTGSMADTILPNDWIITHAQDSYEVGDIVTYQTDGASVTHRIVQKTKTGFLTKGDANNAADPEISQTQILGKVVAILPKVGVIIGFLQTPLGMLCLLLLMAAIWFLPSVLHKKSKPQ